MVVAINNSLTTCTSMELTTVGGASYADSAANRWTQINQLVIVTLWDFRVPSGTTNNTVLVTDLPKPTHGVIASVMGDSQKCIRLQIFADGNIGKLGNMFMGTISSDIALNGEIIYFCE